MPLEFWDHLLYTVCCSELMQSRIHCVILNMHIIFSYDSMHSTCIQTKNKMNERKSEQAHIPYAPTLHENAVYNEWQFQA